MQIGSKVPDREGEELKKCFNYLPSSPSIARMFRLGGGEGGSASRGREGKVWTPHYECSIVLRGKGVLSPWSEIDFC